MKHILFVTEKFCDGIPSLPYSTNNHHMIQTFEQSKTNISYNVLHYDESSALYNQHIDYPLVKYCKKYKPDLVIFSLLGGSEMNPSFLAIKQIKDLNIKTCFFWPDTGPGWGSQTISSLGDLADLHVSLDNPSNLLERQLSSKHVFLWIPCDINLFRLDEKTIPVSFIGSKNNYRDRTYFFEALKNKDISILIGGGQREGKLLYNHYAELIRKSYISLNFPISLAGFFQTKARIFEIISSGSLLLEYKNPCTIKYFTPEEDYIEFSHELELIDKVKYYLANKDKMEKIAKSGYNKYHLNYSPEKFWKKILSLI